MEEETRIKAARAALEAERSRLRAELEDLTVQPPDTMTYGSQAASAPQVFDQQRVLALRERAHNQMDQVEAALTRIDQGRFGTCIRCGKPIAAERLEALPWAAHCIDCQRLVSAGRG